MNENINELPAPKLKVLVSQVIVFPIELIVTKIEKSVGKRKDALRRNTSKSGMET